MHPEQISVINGFKCEKNMKVLIVMYISLNKKFSNTQNYFEKQILIYIENLKQTLEDG